MKLNKEINDVKWQKLINWYKLNNKKVKYTPTRFELLLMSPDIPHHEIDNHPFAVAGSEAECEKKEEPNQDQSLLSYFVVPERYADRCVPNCIYGFQKIRDFIMPETSWWNKIMLLVVILDICTVALQSKEQSKSVTQVVNVLGMIFNIIFISEFTFKFLLYGPALYFSNGFHIIDASISMLSVLDFLPSSSPILKFSSILRLVRLVRLARLARLGKLSGLVVKSTKCLSDSVLGQLDIVNIFIDLVNPARNVLIICLVFLFFMSTLGYYLFYGNDSGATPNILFLIDKRLNFDSFGNSFITTFLVFTLDNWYSIMLYFEKVHGWSALVFFTFCIFISRFLFQSVMTSIGIAIMDYNAFQLFFSAAGGNVALIDNILSKMLRRKVSSAFDIWKHAVRYHQKSNAVVMMDSVIIDKDNKSSFTEFLKKKLKKIVINRKHFIFYILDPSSQLYCTIRFIESLSAMQLVFEIANIMILIFAMIALQSQGEMAIPWTFEILCVLMAVMLVETFLKLFLKGFLYFISAMNAVNFFCLLLGVFSIICHRNWRIMILNSFRIIRVLFHIANYASYIVLGNQFSFEPVFVPSLVSAIGSMFSTLVVKLIFLYIFSIIALQIWLGTTNYCSDTNFPEGEYRYTVTDEFPTGCTNVNEAGENLYWYKAENNYDNIFKSYQSIFRVFATNEWVNVLYTSIDAVGLDYNPQENYSQASIIFFVVMIIVSYMTSMVMRGVVYYHYVIKFTERDCTGVLTTRSIMWSLIQV